MLLPLSPISVVLTHLLDVVGPSPRFSLDVRPQLTHCVLGPALRLGNRFGDSCRNVLFLASLYHLGLCVEGLLYLIKTDLRHVAPETPVAAAHWNSPVFESPAQAPSSSRPSSGGLSPGSRGRKARCGSSSEAPSAAIFCRVR